MLDKERIIFLLLWPIVMGIIFYPKLILAREIDEIPRVIYDTDERLELTDLFDLFIIERSHFVAAIINKKYLRSDPVFAFSYIEHSKLGDMRMLCSDERFYDQINPAICTSFLIASDVVVTAGHCILSQRDCENYLFIFNFTDKRDGHGLNRVMNDQVYQCKKVLARKLMASERRDYAIIQLDRAVLTIGKKRFFGIGHPQERAQADRFLVLGHPSGLPLKASDYVVTKERLSKDPEHIFRIKSDTFKGNSGSPVFNRRTGDLEGMIIAGESDYVWDETRGCNKAKVCMGDECSGEVAIKADFIPWRSALMQRIPTEGAPLISPLELLIADGFPLPYQE